MRVIYGTVGRTDVEALNYRQSNGWKLRIIHVPKALMQSNVSTGKEPGDRLAAFLDCGRLI